MLSGAASLIREILHLMLERPQLRESLHAGDDAGVIVRELSVVPLNGVAVPLVHAHVSRPTGRW